MGVGCVSGGNKMSLRSVATSTARLLPDRRRRVAATDSAGGAPASFRGARVPGWPACLHARPA